VDPLRARALAVHVAAHAQLVLDLPGEDAVVGREEPCQVVDEPELSSAAPWSGQPLVSAGVARRRPFIEAKVPNRPPVEHQLCPQAVTAERVEESRQAHSQREAHALARVEAAFGEVEPHPKDVDAA